MASNASGGDPSAYDRVDAGSGRGYEIMKVGHTGITVSDIDRSIDFYRSVLGMPVTAPIRIQGTAVERITGVSGAELDVAFVRARDHVIELLSFVRPVERAKSALRPCDAGFFHLCFKVRAIDAVVEAVRAGGFRTHGPVETLSEGPLAGMRVVYVRDPDGVCLEFAEDPAGVAFEELMLAKATA